MSSSHPHLKFLRALSAFIALTVIHSAALASCRSSNDIDIHWTGTFKVLSTRSKLRTTNPSWIEGGGKRSFGGCVLSLQTLKTYETNEPKDKPVDVYVVGKPCGTKIGETLEGTVERNCCDVIGSTETYEFQACALDSLRLTEIRIRNEKTGKLHRLTSASRYTSGPEIDIKTYEHDWETYASAVKNRDSVICKPITDAQLAAQCRFDAKGTNK